MAMWHAEMGPHRWPWKGLGMEQAPPGDLNAHFMFYKVSALISMKIRGDQGLEMSSVQPRAHKLWV